MVNPDHVHAACPSAHTAREVEYVASSKAFCDAAMKTGFVCTVGVACQTNGAAWYQIEGSLQDYEYSFHDTLATTIEISTIKRPPSQALPGYYEDRFRAGLHGHMKWVADHFAAQSR
jgi:hypothetical protein